MLALIAIAVVSGCDGCKFMLYMFGDEYKTVQPQYKPGMEKKKLAVVVHAPHAVASDFPRLVDDVTAAVTAEFRRCVNEKASGLKGVELVDPRDIKVYKNNNLDWSIADRTKMGKALGADYVLFVCVVDFSTVVEGSGMLLFRGNLLADAKLYDVSLPKDKAMVWPKTTNESGSFTEVFPPYSPTADSDENTVRFMVINSFKTKLVRKFHKHKVRKDEDERPNPALAN